MNKDLDDRLIPNGEYREAVNVSVAKSDASDVGVVKNIQLNESVSSPTIMPLSGISTVLPNPGGLKTGSVSTSIISTNTYNGTDAAGAGYSGTPGVTSGWTTSGSGTGANITIIIDGGTVTAVTVNSSGTGYQPGDTITISKDTGTPAIGGSADVVLTLRENEFGADLYADERYEVVGFYINNASNKMYWFVTNYSSVDSKAYADNAEYTCAIIEQAENTNEYRIVAQGEFLNFNKQYPVLGISMIDDLLFFTDNYNQPRKINVNKPSGFYTHEDQISVAKYYPYKAPRLIKLIKTKFVSINQEDVAITLSTSGNTTTTIPLSDPKSYSVKQGMLVAASGIVDTNIEVKGVVISGSAITVTIGPTTGTATANQTIAAGKDVYFSSTATSMIESSDAGVDKDFLKERFVKFAYRFKFIDGEYSIISPFTQTCFVPEFNKPSSAGDAPNLTSTGGMTLADEELAIKTTELEKMVNYISELDLYIDLPYSQEKLYDSLHVDGIEIIMQEANDSRLKSVDTVEIKSAYKAADTINGESPKSDLLKYTYKSTLPFKILPESEVTRVFDNVPVKAFQQEIVSNRVVYGNITLGNNPPNFYYDLNTSERGSGEFLLNREYPTQTLKQRRSYQVGIVVADRYGRQSSVILPKTGRDTAFLETKTNLGDNASTDSPNFDDGHGYALNINFTQAVTGDLYTEKNPLGWYSYKVVVKQVEQEYYNVYAPPLLTNYPGSNARTWLTLHGDNINKVPRSLDVNANPDIKTSPSKAVLSPKILNTGSSTSNHSNSGSISLFTVGDTKVISIGTARDHGLTEWWDDPEDTGTTKLEVPLRKIYEYKKNHLLAELPNSYGVEFSHFDALLDMGDQNQLVVFETKPFKSALDVYYETSTTGLISELNADIVEGDNIGSIPEPNIKYFSENTAANTFTPVQFKALSPDGTEVTNAVITGEIYQMDDLTTQITYLDIANVPGTSQYKLRVINPQYYGAGGNSKKYRARVTATVSGTSFGPVDIDNIALVNKEIVFNSNLSSQFGNDTSTKTATTPISGGTTLITSFNADNGTAQTTPNNSKSNMNYEIVDVKFGTTIQNAATVTNTQFEMVQGPATDTKSLRVISGNPISTVGYYIVSLKATDTSINNSNYLNESNINTNGPDEQTTDWILHVEASDNDSNEYYFVTKLAQNSQTGIGDQFRYNGWSTYYNSYSYRVWSKQCFDSTACSTSNGYGGLQFGWNLPYPNNAYNDIIPSLNTNNTSQVYGNMNLGNNICGSGTPSYATCHGGTDYKENIIQPAHGIGSSNSKNDNVTLKWFTDRAANTIPNIDSVHGNGFRQWALGPLEIDGNGNAAMSDTNIYLLSCHESGYQSADVEYGDRTWDTKFVDMEFWVVNDAQLITSLKNGSKHIQVKLEEVWIKNTSNTNSALRSSYTRTVFNNIISAEPTNQGSTNDTSIVVTEGRASANGYGQTDVQSGAVVRVKKWKVGSGSDTLTNIIEKAHLYKDPYHNGTNIVSGGTAANTPSSYANHSALCPNVFEISGAPSNLVTAHNAGWSDELNHAAPYSEAYNMLLFPDRVYRATITIVS